MRWDRHLWILRSIQYAVGPQDMDIEVHLYAVGLPDMDIEVQF